MKDRKSENRKIFCDTTNKLENDSELRTRVKNSILKQRFYAEDEQITLPNPKDIPCKTVILGKRSFEAALSYARSGKKVCVLIFACIKRRDWIEDMCEHAGAKY